MSASADVADFIASELKSEYDRRDSVNARAGAALTSATGLVTVVTTVITVLKGKDFTFPPGTAGWLIGALISLLVSSLFAVAAALPWRVHVTNTETLRLLRDQNWYDQAKEIDTRYRITHCYLTTLETLRSGNGFKYFLLLCAATFQIAAIITLLVTACVALR
ncbi:hypothetical protein ACWEK5_40970 [Rhodococcus koreensis]